MSTHQSDYYCITTSEEEHREQTLLDRRNEMRREPSPPSALSTDHESNLHDHCDTTTESLLNHENEISGDELSTDGNKLKYTNHDNPTARFPLHRKKPSILPDWPSSPKPINTPIYVKALNGVSDILLLACSAAFLGFAIVVNLHDRVPTADYPRLTTTLLSATKYGPTVFPILFASIIGRAAHAILLWRLEKGERVGLLDTLASITSFTSTVTSQLQIRSLSILGVVLLVVWSLSPIGGQACVRVMTIGTKDAQIYESLSYMVNNGYLGAYSSAEMFVQGASHAGVVFVAALMGSPATKSSPLDVWGNVKMPRIEKYEGSAPMDDDGWYNVDGGDSDAYSSLIGIPIVGIHESNFINYITRIQSPFLSLKCSVNTTVTNESIVDRMLPGMSSNATSAGSMLFWDLNSRNTSNSSQEIYRDRVPPEAVAPLRIQYIPLYTTDFTFACNITQSYIEAEIQCPTPSTCATRRVRRSKLNHFPPAWTLLDKSWRTPALLFRGMLRKFDGKLRYPQLLERYLSDPYLMNSNYANVSQTTEDKYAIRLGQMLNAYFACLNGFFAITAGINNETAYSWDNNQTFTMPPNVNFSWVDYYDSTTLYDKFKTKTWSSEVTKTERKEVIVAHHGWVVALCLASIVLIVASFVTPFVRHFLTIGVDVAINISSLATRNNPYVLLPETGTYLNASDRARLLSNYQIRFGDADSDKDIGFLVISSFDSVKVQDIIKVQKKRLYK